METARLVLSILLMVLLVLIAGFYLYCIIFSSGIDKRRTKTVTTILVVLTLCVAICTLALNNLM